jgi:hypothetical protein
LRDYITIDDPSERSGQNDSSLLILGTDLNGPIL